MDDIRIETQRLILRPPCGEDFDSWAAFQADAETMTYIGGQKSRAESWRDLCAMVGAWHLPYDRSGEYRLDQAGAAPRLDQSRADTIAGPLSGCPG
jgi:RimJ/RimL family protein N-acetyltransferase